ncbi:inversin-like isoform X1 [Macrobrachium rosenbergii]|uniref:inversin-like isoform X1 n=1 Tax=Macrobrachium rosenbergii TaxID=79674 RepID=UPI0034D6DAAA
MFDAVSNTSEDGAEANLPPLLIQPLTHSMINSPHAYHSFSPYNQPVNYSPSILSHYHGNQYPASLSPCFFSNSPLMPPYLSAPGIPQYGSSPLFHSGAGYHLTHGSPHLGGLYHGTFFSPGQAGLPLHAAAIIGDEQKVKELLQDEGVNLETRDRWGRVALVYAVLGSHLEIVELLLSAGAKPDAVDAQKCTPLHFAAYKGNHGAVKYLLHAVETKSNALGEKHSAVWLAQDMRGVTPLHHAAHHNNQKCLQALVKYVSPGTLDAVDHKKRTPLHWAAAYGSDENVKLLIKQGANNLMPDQEGKTPLHWAAMCKAPGAKGCVKTLISAAPSSVNWQDFDGITALHLAVAETRLDAVDIILSVPKCNVDLTDNQFRTALHWACSRGITTIVGRLLDRGAHIGAVDLYGATPLHYAAQLNHADTVELLVRRPCVRDDPSKEGYTALFWAAARGSDSAITAMVKHGASLTKVGPRGCTPLHIAAGAGHISTVGVLLRLQAPVDVCANDGRTPLLHAAQAGHAHIVKLLAKEGASLDHRDNEGQCALHHAVLNGHLYLAQILIRAGTSVNVQDYSGRTPLHMAAYRGLSDIMFLLLENRGDVNARDHEGQSPLHWASQQGHLGAVNTLLDFHAYPNYTQTTLNGYTPLDCAYVAEQFEIAQVLMEAGGLSVTKIRDIAASKIQAMIRGFLAKREYKRLLSSKDKKSTSLLSVEKVSLSQVPSKPATSTSVKTTMQDVGHQLLKLEGKKICQPQEDLIVPTGFVEATDVKNRDKIVTIKEDSETDADATVIHDPEKLRVSKLLGDSFTGKVASVQGLSTSKSIHHSRRSKGIANNIKLGARKKTVRDLKLPDPGELGIENVETDTVGKNKQSDEDDEDPSVNKAVKACSVRMSQALQYPINIASCLVTANVGISSKVEENLEEEKCSTVSEGKKAEGHKEIPRESENLTLQTSRGVTSVKDYGEVVTHASQGAIDPERLKPNIRSKTSESGNSSHDKSTLRSRTFKGQEKHVDKEERRKLLEERTAKALEVAHKGASISRNIVRPQVLSPSARKQAEEKWNNKLASLTLQVHRQSSAVPAASFSYNLTPPAGTAKRPGKKPRSIMFSDK